MKQIVVYKNAYGNTFETLEQAKAHEDYTRRVRGMYDIVKRSSLDRFSGPYDTAEILVRCREDVLKALA